MILIWIQVLPSFASIEIFCFTGFIETKFYILYSKVYVKTKYEDEGLLKHTEELLAELGPGKAYTIWSFQIYIIYISDRYIMVLPNMCDNFGQFFSVLFIMIHDYKEKK